MESSGEEVLRRFDQEAAVVHLDHPEARPVRLLAVAAVDERQLADFFLVRHRGKEVRWIRSFPLRRPTVRWASNCVPEEAPEC